MNTKGQVKLDTFSQHVGGGGEEGVQREGRGKQIGAKEGWTWTVGRQVQGGGGVRTWPLGQILTLVPLSPTWATQNCMPVISVLLGLTPGVKEKYPLAPGWSPATSYAALDLPVPAEIRIGLPITHFILISFLFILHTHTQRFPCGNKCPRKFTKLRNKML